MRRIQLRTVQSVMLAIFVLGTIGIQGQNRGAGTGARAIEGTWSTSAQFRNCQTGDTFGPPFPAMAMFMQGGTMQEFGVASGMYRSTGMGVWRYEGEQNFSNSFQFFRFNPDGSYSERVVVRRHIQLTSTDSYVATSSVQFFNTTGDLIRQGCASETAVRFE